MLPDFDFVSGTWIVIPGPKWVLDFTTDVAVATVATDWQVSILAGGPWKTASGILVLGGDIQINGIGFGAGDGFVRYLGLGAPVLDVHGSTLAPFGPTPL